MAGDELVLADANFPAASIAKSTHTGSVVMLAGANTTDALEAVCSVMPLDFFVDYAVFRMASNKCDLLPTEVGRREKGEKMCCHLGCTAASGGHRAKGRISLCTASLGALRPQVGHREKG